jgi:hypothetical protein
MDCCASSRSGRARSRTDVFEVLSGTGDPLNAELFAGGIEHPDRFVRFWSAHGLATIGGLAARAGLVQASSSDDADLRLVAAHALPVEHPRVRELATHPHVNVARAARVRLRA